jgi:DNA-binding CsgD family transcriptional regulator
VLDPNLMLVSSTAGARAWIDALPSARLFAAWGMLPSVVYPAATLARSATPARAHALMRTVDGRWVMIEAAPLEGGRHGGEIAVSLRAATTTETFDLLCRVYALSRRERDVVALLVAGLDTRAITERLFISPHTVQDHLKSVFDKIGSTAAANSSRHSPLRPTEPRADSLHTGRFRHATRELPEPPARGRATARASLLRAWIAEVREGGDALAPALPRAKGLAAAPALRGDHGESCPARP